MNKKQKIILRRGVVQLSAAFFTLTVFLAACKKEETAIGESLENASLDAVVTDTFTIVTYSDELEDMESDETSINMLGAYNDPIFGGVDCGFVTQIIPSAPNTNFPDDIVMDSVVLALRYSSINYYANLSDITVEVYEINDALVRTDQVYAVSEEPTIVGDNLVLPGSETLTPDFIKEPIVGDDTLSPQLRIHLTTDFGMDLLADSASYDNFTDVFKGLYAKVNMPGLSPGMGTVLYFSLEDALSKVSMYYNSPSGTGTFDFLINSNAARYNKVTFDRSGTSVEAALADISKGEEAFYMQGSSIRAVVELPYITDFYTNAEGEKDPKIINKAELVLPIQDFQPDVFDPATRLFIARVVDDKLSEFTADYGNSSTIDGNTVAYDEDNKEFRFTMTQEVQALLNGTVENVGYRIYPPAFFASTVERIVFNGPKSLLKDKPRLEITYTEY